MIQFDLGIFGPMDGSTTAISSDDWQVELPPKAMKELLAPCERLGPNIWWTYHLRYLSM